MNAIRNLMLFWAYFVGLSALLGAAMMFVDPSGVAWKMETLLPVLKTGLPMFSSLFNDFIASGIVLLMVAGVPNFIAIALTHKNSRFAMLSNIIAAIMLIAWILLEFYVWGLVLPSILYFVFGVLQLLTAVAAVFKSKKH